jgi:glycosyltransferase involved in cell wall biosynthesis
MNDARTVVTQVASGDLWAGAEVQVFNLCKALNDAGVVQPTAVVFNPGILHDRLKQLGIPVTLADENRLGPLAIVSAIVSHCHQNKSYVLHTHGFKENVLGVTAKLIASVPRSVRTVHGNPESVFNVRRPHKWAVQKLDIWLGQLFQNHIIAVSSQLEKALGPIFPGKIETIHNFIDVDALRSKATPQWKSNKVPVFGLVGRLVSVKRVDIFLETIALLNKRGISCIAKIYGAGPLEQELKYQAEQLGIGRAVEFKGFTREIYSEIPKLDALIITSDHEGLPMTILEAIALEVPIVAHSVGGIQEVIDENSGWLVTQHNAEGYANAIRSLLIDKNSTILKTKKALEHIISHYGPQHQIRKYHKLYLPQWKAAE